MPVGGAHWVHRARSLQAVLLDLAGRGAVAIEPEDGGGRRCWAMVRTEQATRAARSG